MARGARCSRRRRASWSCPDRCRWARRSLGVEDLERAIVCLCRQLVFDGAHLVEEAPVEPELPQLAATSDAPPPARTPASACSTARRAPLDGLRHLLDAPDPSPAWPRRAPRAARASPSGTPDPWLGLARPRRRRTRELEQRLGPADGIAHDAPRLVDLDRLRQRRPPLARTRPTNRSG
jgi:hypothetical protein